MFIYRQHHWKYQKRKCFVQRQRQAASRSCATHPHSVHWTLYTHRIEVIFYVPHQKAAVYDIVAVYRYVCISYRSMLRSSVKAESLKYASSLRHRTMQVHFIYTWFCLQTLMCTYIYYLYIVQMLISWLSYRRHAKLLLCSSKFQVKVMTSKVIWIISGKYELVIAIIS